MKQVRKSVLLWYSPAEIYRLVNDIERYPEFLPWCERVEVLSRDEHNVTARLHLAYSGLRHAFTTRNETV
ncbi:MAG: ubiquinone-binding protein, partial [Rhizobacter sp.]|nr:ubiquinone-binding protein [Rhizobacter sp.]